MFADELQATNFHLAYMKCILTGDGLMLSSQGTSDKLLLKCSLFHKLNKLSVIGLMLGGAWQRGDQSSLLNRLLCIVFDQSAPKHMLISCPHCHPACALCPCADALHGLLSSNKQDPLDSKLAPLDSCNKRFPSDLNGPCKLTTGSKEMTYIGNSKYDLPEVKN